MVESVLDSEDVCMAAFGIFSLMVASPGHERGSHYCLPLYEFLDLQCIDSHGRDDLDSWETQ